jgi:hypothetical protein
MNFLNFGTELINLNQVYEIDLKGVEGGFQLVFFYHIAGSISGGVKTSKPYRTEEDATAALIDMGVRIFPSTGDMIETTE